MAEEFPLVAQKVRDDYYHCVKCNKTLKRDNFYSTLDKQPLALCKKCLTMHINPYDESTFLDAIKMTGIPYVRQEWNEVRDKQYIKNPKATGMAVFGKYVSRMKLSQWKKYTWEDSEKLQEEADAKDSALSVDEKAQYEAQLREKLEQGLITETQYKMYKTMDQELEERRKEDEARRDAELRADLPQVTQPFVNRSPVANNFYDDTIMENMEYLEDAPDLTQEEKMYLAQKWGYTYTVQQWLKLETFYKEYESSFDINDADSEHSIIILAKVNLKMNEALDSGDLEGYAKIARTYNDTRKTAKLTAAQKKDVEVKTLDSAGQIVAFCEKVGGYIPEYKVDIPQDVVDVIIQDTHDYLRSLIADDVSLNQRIEDYITKRELMDQADQTSAALDHPEELTDEDMAARLTQIAEERELDEMGLLDEFGDDNK